MLEVEGIRKRYDKQHVLEGISFQIAEGTIVGIIGANGCGKSTLLSIIAGSACADEGSVRLLVNGKGYTKGEYVGMTGYVPQTNPLLEQLSVRDNLQFWCQRKESYQRMLQEYDLADIQRKRVSKLSGGMKRRLAIACALANSPALLVMDEPAAALDIYYKQMVHQEMQRFCERGGMILLATHEQEEMQMCRTLYELRDGTLHPVKNYPLTE